MFSSLDIGKQKSIAAELERSPAEVIYSASYHPQTLPLTFLEIHCMKSIQVHCQI